MAADIEFQITEGPYAGTYSIDQGDITANDVGDLLAQHGPDLDDLVRDAAKGVGLRMIAGLVWLVRRRTSKGLAFRAVADHINWNVFEAVQPDKGDEDEGSAEKLPDPSGSASD